MSVIQNNWLVTADSGATHTSHAMVYLGGYLYNILESSPAVITKTNVATQVVTSATFANDNNHNDGICLVYAPSTGFLYAAFQNGANPQLRITQVTPSSLAMTDVISDMAIGFGRGSMDTDNTYMYVANRDNTPFKVWKYKLSDWSSTANATQPFPGCHDIAYDAVSAKLYLTNWGDPLVWTRMTTALVFEDTQSTGMSTGAGPAYATHTMAFLGSYFYVGCENNGNQIVRIAKADLTDFTVISPGITSACFNCCTDGTNIYANFSTVPANVVVMDPTLVFQVLEFTTGTQACNNMAFNGTDKYAVFGPGTQIASVIIDTSGGVVVQPPTDVVVSPATVTLHRRQQQQFSANIPVNWTLVGPGRIAQTGNYTAPSGKPVNTTATVYATDVTDVTNFSSSVVTLVK